MKTFEKFIFHNWARNETCHPEKYFQPQTEAEIISIIHEAASCGKKIRVAGAGHSWSPVVCTNDYLINLDSYDKVIDLDVEKMQIKVQAGIRLKQMNKILDDNGLALINVGSISEQSLAGVASTGTHGTGVGFQILSAAIIEMRMINANGEIVLIEESNPVLDAYRVSLGLLGIISEITLQCREAFSLKEEAEPMRFAKALEDLPRLLRENEHLKFWWFPHVKHMMVYRYNRTKEIRRRKSKLVKWMEDVFLAQYFFAFMLRVGNFFPARIPLINRFISRAHLKEIVSGEELRNF